MTHAQKPDFVFRRNGRVHLNRRGRQFSRLLAAEVCASTVVKRDTPCFEVVLRVLTTHSIRQFPLHFPSRASPCAITFQPDSTALCNTAINIGLNAKCCNSHVEVLWHLWNVVPCSLAERRKCFRGTRCICLHGSTPFVYIQAV